jgi:hypothetical protein
MPRRQTDRAVAEAAPLETARRAEHDRLAVELGPRPDAIGAGIDLIRRELQV